MYDDNDEFVNHFIGLRRLFIDYKNVSICKKVMAPKSKIGACIKKKKLVKII